MKKLVTTALSFRSAYILLRARMNEALATYEISAIEWAILEIVHSNERITLKEVAQKIAVAAPTTTNLVAGLYKKEYIQYTEGPIDRRKKRLQITPKGKTVLKGAAKDMEGILHILFADCSPEDIQGFQKVTQAITTGIHA